MEQINRYGESKVRPAFGKVEDRFSMVHDSTREQVAWSQDPRSESASEHHQNPSEKDLISDEDLEEQAYLKINCFDRVNA